MCRIPGLNSYVLLAVAAIIASAYCYDNGDPNWSVLVCNRYPGTILWLNRLGNEVQRTSLVRSSRSRYTPSRVEYDPVWNVIFWLDTYSSYGYRSIYKTSLMSPNATITRLIMFSRRSNPYDLAYDAKAKRLFYTDYGNGLIAVMDTNGRNRTTLLRRTSNSAKITYPRAIVVDENRRRFYWSDTGYGSISISSARYDGTDVRVVVGYDLRTVNGLAIDIQNNILFWCDSSTDRIESISTNGTGRQLLFNNSRSNCLDIFYSNKKLYFIDSYQRAIMYMSAGGGNVSSIKSALITNPNGLYVISEKNTDACPSETYGVYCQHTCGHCMRGPCNNVTGQCPYGCLPGWTGDDCKSTCPPKTYSSCIPCGHCADGEACDVNSGYCPYDCRLGWTGIRCDRPCKSNTYGLSCVSCGKCLNSEPCDKATGHCPDGCQRGWTGPHCKSKMLSPNIIQPQPRTDSATVGGAVGGTLGFLLIILLIVIVAILLIKRKRRQALPARPQSSVPTYLPHIHAIPSTQPPAYSNPAAMLNCTYTTQYDQATLVTSEVGPAQDPQVEKPPLPE